MKLKKLFTVGLSMAMFFSVPAYANEPDAVAVYQEMEARSQAMTDMNVYYDYNIDVSDGGTSSSMRMEMNLKANHLQEPDLMKMNIYARMTIGEIVDKSGGPGAVKEVDLFGQPITYNYYYENGMYYIDMMGTKVKYPMPLADMMKEIRSNTALVNTNLDYMQNLTLRTEGENRILTYTMDASRINDLAAQIMGSMSTMQQMPQATESTVNYREISGEYTINPEGYYTNAKMNLVMDMAVSEKEMTMRMSMDMSLADPGQPVSIETPNLEEYTLVNQNVQQ